MSNNRIKITGLGSLVLVGTDKIEPEKEYLVSIKAELKKIEKDIEDKENPVYTFIMAYLTTEQVLECGSSTKLKVEHGKTASQKLRWTIQAVAKAIGEDPETFYQNEISALIEKYNLKLE